MTSKTRQFVPIVAALTAAAAAFAAHAGQVPGALADADVAPSHHDRVYASEQFSNTVWSPIRSTTSCWA